MAYEIRSVDSVAGRGTGRFNPGMGEDAGDEQAPRRSPISGFGADVDTGRMTRYGADGSRETSFAGEAEQAAGSPAQDVYRQMRGLVDEGNARRKKARDMSDAVLSSGLVLAKENGGFIPQDVLQDMSARLGFDVGGGNFTSDGNFVLYGRDPRTNSIMPVAVASPDMQMGVLQRSGIGVDLQKQIWDKHYKGRLSKDVLAARGVRDPYAAPELDPKVALEMRKMDMDQRNANLASAQKQLDMLQKQRATILDAGDPRAQELDRQISVYNTLVGATLAGGLDSWSAALGISGGGAQRRKALRVEGEREIKPTHTITRDSSFGLWGGTKVPHLSFDDKTGEALVATKMKDANGEWINLRLNDGDTIWDEDDHVYYREGDQVFSQHYDKYPIKKESTDDGVVFTEGGTKTIIPNGKVVSLGTNEDGTPKNVKVVEEGGHVRLVRTDEKANWTAKDSADYFARKREAETAEKKEAQRKDRAETARRRREQEMKDLGASRAAANGQPTHYRMR